MVRKGIFIIVLIVAGLTAWPASGLELQSRDIAEGEPIAAVFTCSGRNISPQLEWEDVPPDTQSFVLICDDPDAPTGTWVHWVLYNIPAQVRELDQGVSTAEVLDDDGRQGLNDFQQFGYGGPCPPPGRPHRYVFTLYALDASLPLAGPVRKEQVVAAMQTHVLGKASLTGTFKR